MECALCFCSLVMGQVECKHCRRGDTETEVILVEAFHADADAQPSLESHGSDPTLEGQGEEDDTTKVADEDPATAVEEELPKANRRSSRTETTASLRHVRSLTCLEVDHVRSVTKSLEDPSEIEAAEFEQRCRDAFQQADADGSGFLEADGESEQIAEAVKAVLPANFLSRMQVTKAEHCAMAFDVDRDGMLSEDEFVQFAKWALAMNERGFSKGQTPFEIVGNGTGDRLMLVSEYLDEEGTLQQSLKKGVDLALYHPNGITCEEFAAQLKVAGARRKALGLEPYKSVALSNHGPDESGKWAAFAGPPRDLTCLAECAELLPIFKALTELLVAGSTEGRLDLLSCNLASVPGGLDFVKRLEAQAGGPRVCASQDETGNVANGGNWILEVGDVNVAPDYFDEAQLESFDRLMAGGGKKMARSGSAQRTKSSRPGHMEKAKKRSSAGKKRCVTKTEDSGSDSE